MQRDAADQGVFIWQYVTWFTFILSSICYLAMSFIDYLFTFVFSVFIVVLGVMDPSHSLHIPTCSQRGNIMFHVMYFALHYELFCVVSLS